MGQPVQNLRNVRAVDAERHVGYPEPVEQPVGARAHLSLVGQLDEVVGPRCDGIGNSPKHHE